MRTCGLLDINFFFFFLDIDFLRFIHHQRIWQRGEVSKIESVLIKKFFFKGKAVFQPLLFLVHFICNGTTCLPLKYFQLSLNVIFYFSRF